jgi:CRISPR-associated protein Csd1
MILENLVRYYDVLSEGNNPLVAPIGFSSEKVSFEVLLSAGGEIVDIVDLRRESGKKSEPIKMFVPLQEIRPGKQEKAYFLSDKSKYVFGLDNKGVAQKHFNAFKELHIKLLKGVDDEEAVTLLNYLEKWNPATAEENLFIQKIGTEEIVFAPNFVFRVDGCNHRIHENAKIKRIWEQYFESDSSTAKYTAQCLITGEKESSIAGVHQSIKGVMGAQSSGAAIISFNKASFESYGKKQSYNAPVSQNAMLKYTASLNYLLSSKKRINIGDTTIVYWAERLSPNEEDLFKELLNPSVKKEAMVSDSNSSQAETAAEMEKNIKDILSAIRNGTKATIPGYNSDIKFHILGLAPNAARISIRFWLVNKFGYFLEKVGKHHLDMEIEKPLNAFTNVPMWELLKQLAVQGKAENIPNSLITSLHYAIFNGTSYPYAMLTYIIRRIRADKEVNDVRAGFIKAYLIRANREKEEFTVALNEENKSPAYLLGRLFSLLEKVQSDASGGKLNSTIKDRYFGAASATPAVAFPQLMRLSQHHISKAEFGDYVDRKIQNVVNDLDGFPKHLDLYEQGMFILGYYQQKEANYSAKTKNHEPETPC